MDTIETTFLFEAVQPPEWEQNHHLDCDLCDSSLPRGIQ